MISSNSSRAKQLRARDGLCAGVKGPSRTGTGACTTRCWPTQRRTTSSRTSRRRAAPGHVWHQDRRPAAKPLHKNKEADKEAALRHMEFVSVTFSLSVKAGVCVGDADDEEGVPGDWLGPCTTHDGRLSRVDAPRHGRCAAALHAGPVDCTARLVRHHLVGRLHVDVRRRARGNVRPDERGVAGVRRRDKRRARRQAHRQAHGLLVELLG
ncbi:hypothetical protein L7F22_033224 [Adiantum nelumboides]|nr:hypothetical protein [Adiantum nelumboides]